MCIRDRPTSFLTATVLLAYKDSEQAFGLKPDARVVKRAVACLEKLRTPAGTLGIEISTSESREQLHHLQVRRHHCGWFYIMEGFQVTEIGEKIYCILDAGN